MLSIVPVGNMDAVTTCHIRVVRLTWWTNVSSSAGDIE